jgi:tetratricopeptide (TPR) repeat protein
MSDVKPKRYDAFLSYNSQDRPAVMELAGRLRNQKLTLYLDQWELAPGRHFVSELAEALRSSKSCVVFLGRSGLAPWQKQEISVAIDRRTHDEEFHVVPVLLPGTERPRRGDVAHLEFLINASWVEFLKTLDDEAAFRSLVWGITGARPPEPDATRHEGVCPYRGLEAFGPNDAQFYFGRESLTGWLVSALRREVRAVSHGVRFLGVIGPSGSGKSSVVLAGLVPKLRDGVIEGSEHWPVAIIRPGHDPLKFMTEQIVPKMRELRPDPELSEMGEQSDLIARMRAGTSDAAVALDHYAGLKLSNKPPDLKFLVVIDQFEELFTYRPEDGKVRERFESDRDTYVANLLNAAAAPGGRVAVLLTMRSDFLGACAAFPQLSAVLSAHQELVGPMTSDELREAIVMPALTVGHEVDQGLVERLLADIKGQWGALPHLQFALTEVWKKQDARRLTVRAYEELGKDDQGRPRGIEGALEHRANAIYRSLSPPDQELCRKVFLRLVQPGEGTEDTKRRVLLSSLLPANYERVEDAKKLIYALSERDARLITIDSADTDDGWVEVAHEALIQGWSTLRLWVDADRAGLHTHRQLAAAAQEWATHLEDDYLYKGAQLAVAREWAASHGDELNLQESRFLGASVSAERRRAAAESEGMWGKRRASRIALLSVVLAVACGGVTARLYMREQTTRRSNLSVARLALYDARERLGKALDKGDRSSWEFASEAVKNALIHARSTGDAELLKEVQAESGKMLKSIPMTSEDVQNSKTERNALTRLEEVRIQAVGGNADEIGHRLDCTRVLADFHSIFQYYSTIANALPGPGVFRDIEIAAIRHTLTAALDDYADWTRDKSLARRVRALTREVDPDPLRNKVRDALDRSDQLALKRIAATVNVDLADPATLERVGRALESVVGVQEAVTFLRRAQYSHADDFWINVALAGAVSALKPANPQEAIRHYMVALALRPGTAGIYVKIAKLQKDLGNYNEAVANLDLAFAKNPPSSWAYSSRGDVWMSKNEYDLAIADFSHAIQLDRNGAATLRRINFWSLRNAIIGLGAQTRAETSSDKTTTDYGETIRREVRLKFAWTYLGRSVARLLAHQRDAVQGFRETVDVLGWDSEWAVYAVIMGNLAARQLGDITAAKTFIDDSVGKLDTAWPYPIVRYLCGEIDELALLKLAVDNDMETLARCYLGLDHMVEGRKDKAAAHLRWVVEHGNGALIEYTIASAELDRLTKPPPAAR